MYARPFSDERLKTGNSCVINCSKKEQRIIDYSLFSGHKFISIMKVLSVSCSLMVMFFLSLSLTVVEKLM